MRLKRGRKKMTTEVESKSNGAGEAAPAAAAEAAKKGLDNGKPAEEDKENEKVEENSTDKEATAAAQDVEIQETVNDDDIVGLDEDEDRPRRRSWDRFRGRERRNSRYYIQWLRCISNLIFLYINSLGISTRFGL